MIFIIIVLVIVAGLLLMNQIGKYSGYATYYAEANAALQKDSNRRDAILAGLKLISHRKPFSDLTDSDRSYLAEVFDLVGGIETIKPLILEAERRRSVASLKNRQYVLDQANIIKTGSP